MAMNKYGRFSRQNTTTSEDPNKPKKATEDQLRANMDAIEAQKQMDETYRQETEAYNKAIKLYREGPDQSNAKDGIDLSGTTNKKGKKVNYTSGYFTAESMNKATNKQIKSGDVVSIDDPSIDAQTRKLMKGALRGIGGNDLYGKTTGPVYVQKGLKYKSYKDIYGEDFNPDEFYAESKKGIDSFNKYLDAKGYKNRSFHPNFGYTQLYEEPKAPVKPVYEKIEPIKPNDVDWKTPTLPKAKAVQSKMKYLKDNNAVSEGNWESPVPSKYGVSIDKSKEGGQSGKFGLRNKIVGSNGDKKLTASLGINITKGGGRREEKMAKSFYAPTSDLNHGSYYSSMSETTQDDLSKSIRSKVKDIKEERKDWKKNTSLTGADKREGMSMYKQDIKTGRLAARYAKKGNLYSTGGNEWGAGSGSKLRTWTPDQDKLGNEGAMSGYVKSAKQNIERIGQLKQAEQRNITNANIAESNRSFSKKENYIKSAEDNATNRNSTQARMSEYWGWNKKVK